jgi:hypothetical protein
MLTRDIRILVASRSGAIATWIWRSSRSGRACPRLSIPCSGSMACRTTLVLETLADLYPKTLRIGLPAGRQLDLLLQASAAANEIWLRQAVRHERIHRLQLRLDPGLDHFKRLDQGRVIQIGNFFQHHVQLILQTVGNTGWDGFPGRQQVGDLTYPAVAIGQVQVHLLLGGGSQRQECILAERFQRI